MTAPEQNSNDVPPVAPNGREPALPFSGDIVSDGRTTSVKVFRYIPELDAFLPTERYADLAERLGLSEWTPVVWVGRYLALDNDFGEHWHDNWDGRDALEERATALGHDPWQLLIVRPDRFTDGRDGPCHPPELRKRFWTDVMKSLPLDLETLFAQARLHNQWRRDDDPDDPDDPEITDLEARIEAVRNQHQSQK